MQTEEFLRLADANLFFFSPKKTDLKKHKHLETVTQKRELHRNKTVAIVLKKNISRTDIRGETGKNIYKITTSFNYNSKSK